MSPRPLRSEPTGSVPAPAPSSRPSYAVISHADSLAASIKMALFLTPCLPLMESVELCNVTNAICYLFLSGTTIDASAGAA
jgi:hypothetical protein